MAVDHGSNQPFGEARQLRMHTRIRITRGETTVSAAARRRMDFSSSPRDRQNKLNYDRRGMASEQEPCNRYNFSRRCPHQRFDKLILDKVLYPSDFAFPTIINTNYK